MPGFKPLISVWLLPAIVLMAAQAKPPQNKETFPPVHGEGVCFVLYTLHARILKLTAHLYPLKPGDNQVAELQIRQNTTEKWKAIAKTKIRTGHYAVPKGSQSWTAHFRIENWASSQDWQFRVVTHGGKKEYTGRIRRDPLDKEEIVVAAFTGNSSRDLRLKPDIIAAIKAVDADLLFFSGDQVYTEKNHAYGWLRFGQQYGEITRDRPTICIPDDHDVGQGNLWGAGGKKSKGRPFHDGGYVMPPFHVREVEYVQTSHLPDPVDPRPVQQGIGVYFTRLCWGRIDFAIIEDRKFKSGPRMVLKSRHTKPDDPETWDSPEAKLLGQRQLTFLRKWAADWKGVDQKCVLSQTIFSTIYTRRPHPNPAEREDLRSQPPNSNPRYPCKAGLANWGATDSNGWPRHGRNRALREIRKGFAFHISGDVHLGAVIRYGIDDWNDAGYAFCVPSIVNYWPRYWSPQCRPCQGIPGRDSRFGQFYDVFGNRLTMLAVANPDPKATKMHKADPKRPRFAGDGFGIVRFNKKSGLITVECWPRFTDLRSPKAKQYDGWPVRFHYLDNYARKPVAYLPVVRVHGIVHPVIQVIDQATQEIVYTVRILTPSWRPPVFAAGRYLLRAGDPDHDLWKTIPSVAPSEETREIDVDFNTITPGRKEP